LTKQRSHFFDTTPKREEHAMTPTSLSRRDVLKGMTALAAAVSVGVNTATRSRRAEAQESAARPRARIDSTLRQAVDAQDVPGIVAMAATSQHQIGFNECGS
jgi:hypothetical protein